MEIEVIWDRRPSNSSTTERISTFPYLDGKFSLRINDFGHP